MELRFICQVAPPCDHTQKSTFSEPCTWWQYLWGDVWTISSLLFMSSEDKMVLELGERRSCHYVLLTGSLGKRWVLDHIVFLKIPQSDGRPFEVVR